MPSPAAADSTSEMKKGTFPAVAMAEASLLSQQATLRKACNFVALFGFQHEKLSLCKDEKKLGYREQNIHRLIIQKIVEGCVPNWIPLKNLQVRNTSSR
jgi:hypothetical protein